MPLFTYSYTSLEHGGRMVTLDCWADAPAAAAERAAAFLRPVNARLRRAGVRGVRLPAPAELRPAARAAEEPAHAE